jgi:YidC/Oxa1 family membrane protein insertase
MDRRTLLFIGVSILIIVAYQELVLKRIAPPSAPSAVREESVADPSGSPSPATARSADTAANDRGSADLPSVETTAPAQLPAGRSITIDTDLYTTVLNTRGGRIETFTLKKFRAINAPGSPPLDLIVTGADAELPMGLELRGARVWSDAGSVYDSPSSDVRISGDQQAAVELHTEIAGQPLVKRLTFRGNDYPIDLRVETPAASSLAHELIEPAPGGGPTGVALVWSKTLSHEKNAGGVFVGAAAVINGKLVQTSAESLKNPENLPGDVAWAGYEDHYFLSAVAPARASLVALRPRGDAIETKIVTARQGDGPLTVDYTLFLGPKESSALEAAGHDLQRSLNLGWFGPISLFLLRILNLSHRVTGNYGLDIIFLTILVKIAFWPLTQKSFQSMRGMQKLQPEMAKLREKYKEDPKQMNAEIMELYKRHKVNPLGGCLPMVLQIPVFFGLYQGAFEHDPASSRTVLRLDHGPFGTGAADHPRIRHSRSDPAARALHVPPAENGASDRRSNAAEGDDVHADHLHLHVHRLPGGIDALLAHQQRVDDRAAVLRDALCSPTGTGPDLTPFRGPTAVK